MLRRSKKVSKPTTRQLHPRLSDKLKQKTPPSREGDKTEPQEEEMSEEEEEGSRTRTRAVRENTPREMTPAEEEQQQRREEARSVRGLV